MPLSLSLPGLVSAPRPVAQGASAQVLQARLSSGVCLAIKVARSPEAWPHLVSEALRLAWIDAAGVPELIAAGRWRGGDLDGAPWLALRWVEGRPLSPGTDAPLAARVARDLGAALAALERVGVAHGDLKPENTLIDASSGRVWLVDLGLGGDAAGLQIEGGTLRYLAPEGLAGERVERRFLDRYALGVVLAELLSPSAAAAADPAAVFLADPAPGPLGALAVALLAAAPLARPSPATVAREAASLLGLGRLEDDAISEVRAAYTWARRAELEACAAAREVRVEGPVAPWLPGLVARLRAARALVGEPGGAPVVLGPLDQRGLRRWLSSLVGPAAAAWPVGQISASEEAVAGALLRLAARAAPAGWRFEDLRAEIEGRAGQQARPAPVAELSALALALGRPAPDAASLEAGEALVARGGAPEALHAALLDALRRSGQPDRALLLVSEASPPAVRVAGAESARRVRDFGRAWRLASSVAAEGGPAAARARAVAARVLLDQGDPRAALAQLDYPFTDSPSAEVAALARAAQGEAVAALAEAERGLLLAHDDEARARVEAVAGYLAHGRGDAREALRAYAAAADAAARAGAALEEATYRTGEAAAATDAGALAAGMAAAERAVALWDALGRPAEAARASLSHAAALRVAGAFDEAARLARESIALARQGSDRRAELYAGLVLADACPAEAAALLGPLAGLADDPADRLRLRARLLAADAAAAFVPEGDALAADPSTPLPARLEWWTARAASFREPRGEIPGRPQDALAALLSCIDQEGPLATRGEAADAGRRLALALGDGAAAGRLGAIQRGLALRLLDGCPAALRAAFSAQRWVSEASAQGGAGALSSAQQEELIRLLRAFSSRDRLRPLLEQTVDALILWTGVERGLLLMPAPDGRLVPRVARNLSRDDLRGEQLRLSRTLARRALDEQRPVVAVDAAGESTDTRESIHLLRLRSVLAVPLIARGVTLGVVYLDDRMRRGAFGPGEIGWVNLVASLAAFAIADARDQVLLRRAVRRARRAQEALAETLAAREDALAAVERSIAAGPRARHEEIVGTSAILARALHLVDRVAPTDVPVLLLGETGTGKELFARAIHRHSRRQRERFLSENCGAIPEPLLESTLFGHARGAFTGAVASRVGLFELADRGTLFLDEVGEMSVAMQTKLLRVLQDGEVRAVGAAVSRRVDVRVLCATHRDLAAMVREGKFREDLYYRLRVIEIAVPPLRERREDIPLLVKHLIARHGEGRPCRVSAAALERLVAAPWPGNVRQLENVIRAALVLSDGTIERSHLSGLDATSAAPTAAAGSGSLRLKERVDALESELIREAMQRTRGNQSRAAELLGVSRFGLQKMLKRLGIVTNQAYREG
jgi:transcriptional regulator with GAF, ATPase, and Fis domain